MIDGHVTRTDLLVQVYKWQWGCATCVPAEVRSVLTINQIMVQSLSSLA